MQPKLDVLLWEIKTQADLIRELTDGKTFQDYGSDRLVRWSVERNFIILGEVLVRLRKTLPSDYRRLIDAAAVVDFRNQLVHQYDITGDLEVWQMITTLLPQLSLEAAEMLREQQP